MKVCVVGGGSTYTPELVQGFLGRQNDLSLEELWLVDVDAERLDVVGGFAQPLLQQLIGARDDGLQGLDPALQIADPLLLMRGQGRALLHEVRHDLDLGVGHAAGQPTPLPSSDEAGEVAASDNDDKAEDVVDALRPH